MKARAQAKTPEPGQILSVGDVTRRIKILLEDALPEAWIRGEVSNLRRQPSGHVYFTLKDAESQLPCVFFRGEALRCAVDLRDGKQLLVLGRLSVYEPRGAYQLIVSAALEDGVGRLREEFEKLKAKLAAEGLFELERKRELPARVSTVGFITSTSGAAVRDFISILRRRGWRGRLVILPAKVQGREAAREMAAQLAQAARLGIFDLLVIGRGGGSLEDLWAFNEEVLVRAIAASPVPIISAVGHETDFTLSDFAADRRAETPSAAAELISSAELEQREALGDFARELRDFAEGELERRRARLELLAHRRLAASPRAFIEPQFLRLDDGASRLQLAMRQAVHRRRSELHSRAAALAERAPGPRVRVERARAVALGKQLVRLGKTALAPHRAELKNLERRLRETGVARVLQRGFVILSDATGAPVTRRANLKPRQKVRARFADGEAGLTAD
ncbi:MAG TPA: exodeoxyribonuclease VII large subunit [Opitutales bacterium]|nr:exodeoxyribonuclease VII large subunit [Opitutales bacterium]